MWFIPSVDSKPLKEANCHLFRTRARVEVFLNVPGFPGIEVISIGLAGQETLVMQVQYQQCTLRKGNAMDPRQAMSQKTGLDSSL